MAASWRRAVMPNCCWPARCMRGWRSCSLPTRRWPDRLLRGRQRCWRDAQQRAIVLVGQYIKQAVRPLAHIADALVQGCEQRFAAQFLELLIEHHPLEATGSGNLATSPTAHEEIALPGREPVRVIERKPSGRNGRHPQHQWLLHIIGYRQGRMARAVVVAAEA